MVAQARVGRERSLRADRTTVAGTGAGSRETARPSALPNQGEDMQSMTSRTLLGLVWVAGIAALLAFVTADAPARAQTPSPEPEPERIQAENACYVRLPDLPAERYGAFGGYNPTTGVMTLAGGATKLPGNESRALTYHELFAIELDGRMDAWNEVPYSSNYGYARERHHGCREMTGVQAAPGLWVSVLGKEGCDGGAIDPVTYVAGDVKMLSIGDSADRKGVSWLQSTLSVPSVPPDLLRHLGRLTRHFAVVDGTRGRAIFGQGTFDPDSDRDTESKIYSAVLAGKKWQVRELHPKGSVPARRFGSCAAYVSDEDTGLDGAIVVGGRQGGTAGYKTYREVWWLDFSAGADGTWTEITDRFDNMDVFGWRYDGACALNADAKQLYWWMGRADDSIPEGQDPSGGLWRVDLSSLADPQATLHWERLAQDNLAGFEGRELIPSVFDWANNRLFAIGGRSGARSFGDVWALYPDVTGNDCATLDPYAPFRPTEPPTPGPGTPTAPPPTGGPPLSPEVCDGLGQRVPQVVIDAAVANPQSVSGWGELCNPNVPPAPWNGQRHYLGLRSSGQPYHPVYNSVVWQCGCR